MPFKKEDDYNISELGNWNVAADYSRLKIMKPLYLCDIYENLAKFGYDHILEQLINFSIPSDKIRLTGFERLVHELLRLIKNSKFAVKIGKTPEKLEELEERLEKIRDIIPLLSKSTQNFIKKTTTIKIDEEKYQKAVDIVFSWLFTFINN